MARVIDADTIDWRVYERDTDAKTRVRPASIFADELVAQFAPRPAKGSRRARMISTKLRTAVDFRPGETTVWAGYNGHRKSMFAGQVALDLCCLAEPTLIASFEMQPAVTLARAARQCFACAQPSERQLRMFSDWTDRRLWLFDHMGRVEPARLLAVLRYFGEELRGRHAFVDSMMMVCASEDELDQQKQFMTDLVRLAQETDLHVHLIAHCRKPQGGDESKPPTKYDLRGSAAISDQAHNVITVWANKAKKAILEANPNDEKAIDQPDAAVTVEKQRNGAFEGRLKLWWDEASFRFTDERTTPLEPYPVALEEAAA